MKFLDRGATEAAIKHLLANAKRVRVAVAYWGDRATDRLGINTNTTPDIEIVCDARHGGCNPDEIRRLKVALGNDRVLTCDQLHAKVWLADRVAIIGSSNASANGLGHEGDETFGLIEANVLVDDPEILKNIEIWFENNVRPGARAITDDDLRRAQRSWKDRRAFRPWSRTGSILELLRRDPAELYDRNLLVWIWPHGDSDDWADDLFNEEKEIRKDSRIDFYQDSSAPAGSYILDFDSSSGSAKYSGLYRVLDDPIVRDQKGRGMVLLCVRARSFRGLTLGNRAAWEEIATRAAKSTPGGEWEGDVETFRRQFLS